MPAKYIRTYVCACNVCIAKNPIHTIFEFGICENREAPGSHGSAYTYVGGISRCIYDSIGVSNGAINASPSVSSLYSYVFLPAFLSA